MKVNIYSNRIRPSNLRKLCYLLVLSISIFNFVFYPSVKALTENDLMAIYRNATFYDPDFEYIEVGAGNTIYAGNIVQTALSLAWHEQYPKDEKNRKEDATPAYQEALPQYNSNYPGSDWDIWSDCGAFVGTVVAATGIDPDYKDRGTSLQMDYLLNKQVGKWQVYPFDNDTSSLQPGDILIHGPDGPDDTTGHTQIWIGPFTGTDGKTYNIVEASWQSRVPMAGNFYPRSDWYVVRAL